MLIKPTNLESLRQKYTQYNELVNSRKYDEVLRSENEKDDLLTFTDNDEYIKKLIKDRLYLDQIDLALTGKDVFNDRYCYIKMPDNASTYNIKMLIEFKKMLEYIKDQQIIRVKGEDSHAINGLGWEWMDPTTDSGLLALILLLLPISFCILGSIAGALTLPAVGIIIGVSLAIPLAITLIGGLIGGAMDLFRINKIKGIRKINEKNVANIDITIESIDKYFTDKNIDVSSYQMLDCITFSKQISCKIIADKLKKDIDKLEDEAKEQEAAKAFQKKLSVKIGIQVDASEVKNITDYADKNPDSVLDYYFKNNQKHFFVSLADIKKDDDTKIYGVIAEVNQLQEKFPGANFFVISRESIKKTIEIAEKKQNNQQNQTFIDRGM